MLPNFAKSLESEQVKLDRIASVAMFLVGFVVVREGFQLPYTTGFSPGPGFFLLWVGGILMLLSVVLFVTTRRKDMPFVRNPAGFRKAALVALSLIAYIFALNLLGLLLSLALFLAFLVAVVEQRSWRGWVAMSVLGSLSCYLLFEVWLRVPLPRGILGM